MKYIFGNWKMKLAPKEEIELAQKLYSLNFDSKRLEVSIHPTFVSLPIVAQIIHDSQLYLGAQDCFYEDKGAYTGEVSPSAIKEMGCKYVIIGHSERRQYYKETDVMINKKVHAAINNMLTPILCVGERQEERDSGDKDHIVRRQLEKGLQNIEIIKSQRLFIAYEPIWAIGTGKAATTPEINYMHKLIYQTLIDLFSVPVASYNIFILYGGSVDKSNIRELLQEEMVKGVLVGSASVNYEEFRRMIEIGEKV